MANIGFGDHDFSLAVYIANKPSMKEYQALSAMLPLHSGEINVINQACGNGWRKVFNVYAKVLYSLDRQHFSFSIQADTWQLYRDNYLLQSKSRTALLFSAPQLNPNANVFHIICGKGHAKKLIDERKINTNLNWVSEDFAIDKLNKLIVCPYFDYRQLSNIKIERLSNLLLSLK